MRVIMTGGGTGGHINPAIAIANTIKQNIPGSEILFVGRESGLENKLVPAAGYDIKYVEIQGIRRSLSPSNIKTMYLAAVSPYRAKKIIKEFRPDIVIGTGGYVCWPVLRAAAMMGIPSAVHESNAVPGVATKMLAKYVDSIWLNFKETGNSISQKNKLVHVGNPLLGEFSSEEHGEARRKLGVPDECEQYILSYGGSLGAEKVNEAVLELMRDYSSKDGAVHHLHATGAIEYEAATAMFSEYGLEGAENIELLEYIYDMPLRMAAADVVISRAGAMTVSELSMQKKVSIMIPSPNVTNNHQYKNAKVLADAGAAILIEEKELANGRLERELRALRESPQKAEEMRRAIAEFAVPDANKRILEEIRALVKKSEESKK
ncbi:MAG: undecaprenyldiphospho-muramoylpentapeptide beta-N-acetylglucosaminyltransferase [Clostridia bacterium]|nr:undecaprenyldiphospho-muramoylpentapeptide beta-N-acetylglucosaminyltransferase [Clostridia bacterium]